jgi:hypothetical protein
MPAVQQNTEIGQSSYPLRKIDDQTFYVWIATTVEQKIHRAFYQKHLQKHSKKNVFQTSMLVQPLSSLNGK